MQSPAFTVQEGSSLIIVLLISSIMGVLGISFLMMAGVETDLAKNETYTLKAHYAAEAGVRLAISWFNDPTMGGYLVPGPDQVVRRERLLPAGSARDARRLRVVPGDPVRPLYKDPMLTASGLFDRPYGPRNVDAFLGVETGIDTARGRSSAGPDLVVSTRHLSVINAALLPTLHGSVLQARLTRIEIYGPPVVRTATRAIRTGIATIRVSAAVFLHAGTATETEVASRVVRAVIDELPFRRPRGPLQSCADLEAVDTLAIRWGAGSSVGDAHLPSDLHGQVDSGLPYAAGNPLRYIDGDHDLAEWAAFHEGRRVEDPWFSFFAGGRIDQARSNAPQPWPHEFPGDPDTDHSNLFQRTPVECTTFKYNLWKGIARMGGRNHYFFKPEADGRFRLEGSKVSESLRSAMTGRTGVMFFDTSDGKPPNDLSHRDTASNLTREIDLAGEVGARGFIYLNTRHLRISGAVGVERTLVPPGEPEDASGFVNLDYPALPGTGPAIRNRGVAFGMFRDPETGQWTCTDAARCDPDIRLPAPAPVRDEVGLPFRAPVILDGILYLTGALTVQGNTDFYGAVVARQGVRLAGGAARFYFDQSLSAGVWPRSGSGIPRVFVSAWQTDH